jgi:hypothetical protein
MSYGSGLIQNVSFLTSLCIFLPFLRSQLYSFYIVQLHDKYKHEEVAPPSIHGSRWAGTNVDIL